METKFTNVSATSGAISSSFDSVAASGSACGHDFMSLTALAASLRPFCPSGSYCPLGFSCGPNGHPGNDFPSDSCSFGRGDRDLGGGGCGRGYGCDTRLYTYCNHCCSRG